jgi:hypothetical protein
MYSVACLNDMDGNIFGSSNGAPLEYRAGNRKKQGDSKLYFFITFFLSYHGRLCTVDYLKQGIPSDSFKNFSYVMEICCTNLICTRRMKPRLNVHQLNLN